jgi:DNA-binding transcriptional regulator YiaG
MRPADQTKLEEFEVLIPNVDATGVAERIKVLAPVRWEAGVGEWVLTPEGDELIESTKARHIGLLLPAQLKELRQRYGRTQAEMGELFQVGGKSWTRWESGRQRPSRSLNLLLRAVYENELPFAYLLKRAGQRVEYHHTPSALVLNEGESGPGTPGKLGKSEPAGKMPRRRRSRKTAA